MKTKFLLLSSVISIFLVSGICAASDFDGFGNGSKTWSQRRSSKSPEKKVEKRKNYSCTGSVAKAIGLYNQKKYAAMEPILTDAKTQCGGSIIMDTVLYYLGLSYIKTKRYVEAKSELERMVQDYPYSPFFDDAKFRIGQAVYLQSNPSSKDQTETNDAIRIFRDILETNPNTKMADSIKYYLNEAQEKIAQKEFENSKFYEKLKENESAIIYYRSFINDYPESRYKDQALLNMANLLIKLDRKSEAREALDELVGTGKDHDLVKKAGILLHEFGADSSTGDSNPE
jgi:outer membrane protein assembly factor BamD